MKLKPAMIGLIASSAIISVLTSCGSRDATGSVTIVTNAMTASK